MAAARRPRNEALDCRVYAYAALCSLVQHNLNLNKWAAEVATSLDVPVPVAAEDAEVPSAPAPTLPGARPVPPTLPPVAPPPIPPAPPCALRLGAQGEQYVQPLGPSITVVGKTVQERRSRRIIEQLA